METPEYISPTVAESEAQMDDVRIETRAQAGYFRPFWDSYKGHVRGLLVGVIVGGIVAAGIGLAVAGVAGLAGSALLATLALFSGSGALIGADLFGDIGGASAVRASGLAEKHARLLDPAYKNAPLAAVDDTLMAGGNGHHYEFPNDRDKHKFFSWKSGAIGSILGALTGGVLGHAVAGTALASSLPYLGPIAVAAGTTVAAAPVALGAICLGLFGLTFGVDRSLFKSVFNLTDANTQGHILPQDGPDLGKTQSLGKETGAGLEMHRLQRQEDIHELTHQYSSKIFLGTLKGAVRGILGGLVIGAAIGVGIGVLAGLALPALGFAGASLPLLAAACSGAGALLGMGTFASIGKEAGAESTARAIDDEFEHNRILRAHGITPPAPRKEEGHWFNLKTALVMGAVGAIIGIPLAGFLGIGSVIGGLGLVAASALTMGMAGACCGIGDAPLNAINRTVTTLYDRSYIGNPEENLASTPYVPAPVQDTTILESELAQLRAREQRSTGKSFVQSLNSQPSLSVGIH